MEPEPEPLSERSPSTTQLGSEPESAGDSSNSALDVLEINLSQGFGPEAERVRRYVQVRDALEVKRPRRPSRVSQVGVPRFY